MQYEAIWPKAYESPDKVSIRFSLGCDSSFQPFLKTGDSRRHVVYSYSQSCQEALGDLGYKEGPIGTLERLRKFKMNNYFF